MGHRDRFGSGATRAACCVAAVLLLACVVAGASARAARAETSQATPADAADGRALYERSCAPCHGVAGRGDGTEASSFLPKPPVLDASSLAGSSADALVARLRDGLPLTLAPGAGALGRRLGPVEELTTHVERLPEVDWRRVDAGRAVYDARCAACHGPFGAPLAASALPPGVQRPPRDLRDPTFQRATSDAALMAAMEHGKDGMPAIPGLREPGQAESVVVFLRVLSPGFETYSIYCAACHGDDGRGDGVLARGASRPPKAFDRAWRAAKDPEQLRVDVAHMMATHGATMPHLRGALSDAELRAIVRWLKQQG